MQTYEPCQQKYNVGLIHPLIRRGLILCLLSLLLSGCVSHRTLPAQNQIQPSSNTYYTKTAFSHLPNWPGESSSSLQALLQSCHVLAKNPHWQENCQQASSLDPTNTVAITHFFETHFTPWGVHQASGDKGLVTAYYEPLLIGSTTQTAKTPYPVYGTPTDMVFILYPTPLHALSQLVVRRHRSGKFVALLDKDTPGDDKYIVYLKNFSATKTATVLPARRLGNQLVPYYTREEINHGNGTLSMPILAWVGDLIELAYLQIQGSGQIILENGQILRLGYATSNGHTYVSIAHALIRHQKITPDQATMTDIQRWVQQNPSQGMRFINSNPHYVFFRKLDHAPTTGPIGALGIPLTDGYSVAVDPNHIPLGAPLYLSTTYPLSRVPLNRLVMAQDTGSAIRGPIRIDLFWGSGKKAGQQAEKFHQQGRIWLLLPKGLAPLQQD